MSQLGKVLRFQLRELKAVKPMHLLVQDHFPRPLPNAAQIQIGTNVISIHSGNRSIKNRQQ